ncbi:MAG: hypothetical protein WA687_04785 [Solirubrobacterales bacterium]
MALSQIGPLTTVLEAVAAAVGAGIVLGGLVLGTYRSMAQRSRCELETRVLVDGYAGGLVGMAVVLLDLVFR